MSDLAQTKSALTNLLRYTSDILSLNQPVIRELGPSAVAYEHQVTSLAGVEVNVDAETWLRICRLRETPPPAADPMFAGWVDIEKRPSPDKPPRLKTERIVTLSADEVAKRRAEGGIAAADDVMVPLDPKAAAKGDRDVMLRLKAMPQTFHQCWQDYLSGPWAAWAEAERPLRQSIEFYNKLYTVHQRLVAMGDDTPIELVFGLGVVRWRTKTAGEDGQREVRFDVPLIEQQVELDLGSDGAISLRPRTTPPRINLKAFHSLDNAGSKTLQRDIVPNFLRRIEDPDVGFSPFDRATFEWALRSCAARLSANGVYRPDAHHDRGLGEISETLTISDTWVLFTRQRNADFRVDDINTLITRIDAATDLEAIPPCGRRFVLPAGSLCRAGDEDVGIDLSNTSLSVSRRAPAHSPRDGNGSVVGRTDCIEVARFLPLPYNREQLEILQRLEDGATDGVVVQGPPGTGKTHAIANIICHHLATARRVLVTARTPEALVALREKLPEGIRDLTIAVIHNDREGARQLELAVRALANEAAQINKREVEDAIRDKQTRVAELLGAIAKHDQQLGAYAEANLAHQSFGSRDVLPMELARLVREDRARHAWFPDRLDLSDRCITRFGDDEIGEIRCLRRDLGDDLVYGAEDLIPTAILPDAPRVAAAHAALIRLNRIEAAVRSGDTPVMSLSSLGADDARAVQAWLADFADLISELEDVPWLFSYYHARIGCRGRDSAWTAAHRQALTCWVDLSRRANTLALRTVAAGDASLDDPAFQRAIAELSAGRRPFSRLNPFNGRLKALIAAVRIDGRKPVDAADWDSVRCFQAWQQDAAAFVAWWNAIADGIGAPTLDPDVAAGRAEFLRLGNLIENLTRATECIPHVRGRLQALFPYGLDLDAVFIGGQCAVARHALAENLEKHDLADARKLQQEIRALGDNKALPLHRALVAFVERLGCPGLSDVEIIEEWDRLRTEAKRLIARKDALERLDGLCALIAASGAPNWARALRTCPPATDDTLVPVSWQETWQWARAAGFIDALPCRDTIRALAEARAQADADQRRLLAEIVRLRTFLGLKQALDRKPATQSALAKFTAAIGKLGKGTGKSAHRHRRALRDATLEAASAVPCWILPEWRVSEQLPPDLGVFDLVVIDEASQSDITALPALLRGKKVLIVGDDKQVSPAAIGIPDSKIVQLRTTYLTGLPLADHLEPATSIYELGSMIYPGHAIMLREHFRCVEPIIRFSSRFYPAPLVPLRLPLASERLDPPLIDIYLPKGQRRNDINPAEADIICKEICDIVADPAMRQRSLGVISLVGNDQAKFIYDRLVRELGAEAIARHRLMCGSPAVFQGQERHIVFLSMVVDKESAISQSTRQVEQRINVAMSRARDRMVLVRSVAASDLKPGDLKLQVIEHFREPMASGRIATGAAILDACESSFERAFGRRLLEMGYRLRPQVPVGGYRIDFVIEGEGDRRLAVELDGDRYHGPERWADDVRRQNALERLGWTFWRCWGSHWEADPEGCLYDLKATLNRLGIAPIGPSPVEAVYTRHIVIDCAQADAADDAACTKEATTTQLVSADPSSTSRAASTHAPASVNAVVKEPRGWRVPIGTMRYRGINGRPFASREDAVAFTRHQAADRTHARPDDNLTIIPPATRHDEPNSSQRTIGASTLCRAAIGDTVTIRFLDRPGTPERVRLSQSENCPAGGIVQVTTPLGEALIGSAVSDEIEVEVGDRKRTAVVERIEKA